MDGGADRRGAVSEDRDLDGRRKRGAELRQQRLDPVDDRDDVGAGLPLDVEDDGRRQVHPGRLLHVFDAVDHFGDVGQSHRRTVPVGDDQRPVLVARKDLVVGPDRVGLALPVERAFGLVDVRLRDRGPHVLHPQSEGGERGRVHLNANRGLLATADADEADAGELRDLLGEPRVGKVLDLGKRERLGCERERQDRRVRRVDLAVDGRVRQVGREVGPRRVDRRLDLLLRHVDVEVQHELERDYRASSRTARRHLVEPRHLPKLALERGRDGRRHHVRTRARVERHDLNGGVVDLGKRRDREELEPDGAGDQDRRHQQRSRDRPLDERA